MEMQTAEYGDGYAAAAEGPRVILRRERERERERDKGLKGIFETLSRRRGRISRLLVSVAANPAPAAGMTEPAPAPLPADYISAPTHGPSSAGCTAIRVFADQHILPVSNAALPSNHNAQPTYLQDLAVDLPLAPPMASLKPPTKSAARDRSCDWGSEFSDSDHVDTDTEAETTDLAGHGQHHVHDTMQPTQSPIRCDAALADRVRLKVAAACSDVEVHFNARHPYLQAVSAGRLMQPLPTRPHPAAVDEQLQPGYACPDEFDAPNCQHDHVEENIYELPDEQKAALAASIIHGWRTSDSVLVPEDPDVDFLPASDCVSMSSGQASGKSAPSADSRWAGPGVPQHANGPLRSINHRPLAHFPSEIAEAMSARPATMAADARHAAAVHGHSSQMIFTPEHAVCHEAALTSDNGAGRTTGPGAGRQVAARLNQLLAARLSVPDQSSSGSPAAAHALPTRKASLPTAALQSLSGQSAVAAASGPHTPTIRAGSIHPAHYLAPPSAPGRGPGAMDFRDNDATYTDTRQRPAVPPKPQANEALWPRTEADPLDIFPWYHGNIDRAESCRRLIRTGTEGAFLVRRSVKGTQRFGSPYSLSLSAGGRIFHLTIRRRSDGWFALGFEKAGEQAFATVEAMVEQHLQQPIHLAECDKAVLLVMVLTKSIFC